MRPRGLSRNHRKKHRVDIAKERGLGGGSLKNSSEFHSFCGDTVAAASDAPSVLAGHGEEAALITVVSSPTRGSKCPHFTSRRACVRVRPYIMEHGEALLQPDLCSHTLPDCCPTPPPALSPSLFLFFFSYILIEVIR